MKCGIRRGFDGLGFVVKSRDVFSSCVLCSASQALRIVLAFIVVRRAPQRTTVWEFESVLISIKLLTQSGTHAIEMNAPLSSLNSFILGV